MQRQVLEAWLSEGLTVEAIAVRAGKAKSTISYHINRHGLKPVNEKCRSRQEAPPSGEALEQLVLTGASVASIARSIGRSASATSYWIERYGLATARTARRRARRAAHESDASTAPLECPHHGVVEHVRSLSYASFRCRQCLTARKGARYRALKSAMVAAAGGKCWACGYSGRSLRAMEFHHLDPGLKTFSLAKAMRSRSLSSIVEECRKCALMCATCHAEAEDGFITPAELLERRVWSEEAWQRVFSEFSWTLSVRNSVMAARDTLDIEDGVQIPVPQSQRA